MNRFILFFAVAAMTAAASAQTAPKSPSTSTTSQSSSKASATPATKPATSSTATAASAPEPWIKLPPGVPRVVHGPVKMPFALRYEDIVVGKGPDVEPGKLWHIKYTGWRAADGVKFDSWDEHGQPLRDKDGKPIMGPDGKPKLGEPEPLAFPQGQGRVIPGFDYGLDGMKVGGKRRIFIPWQMAYGTREMRGTPDHPGIPPKSDLIFDVELVSVTDMPQQQRPPMPPNRPMPQAPPHPGASAAPGAAPSAPAAPASAPAATPKPAAPAQPATTPPATAPAQPQTPPQPH